MKRAVYAFIVLLVLGSTPVLVAAQASVPSLDEIQQMLDTKQSEAALAAIDERLAANPDDIKTQFFKGLVLLELKQRDAARAVYLDMAERHPELPEPYNNLAAIYVEDKQFERARAALARARENAPEYHLVHVNLADLYLHMAADAYRRAIELDPEDRDSKAKLDRLYELFGDG